MEQRSEQKTGRVRLRLLPVDNRTLGERLQGTLVKLKSFMEAPSGAELDYLDDLQLLINELPGADGYVADSPAPSIIANYEAVEPVVSLRLQFPFEFDGAQLKRIDLRPPSYSALKSALEGEIGELELHATMADVEADALRALRWPDLDLLTCVARLLGPKMKVDR